MSGRPGYFALGLARASRRPVAVVVTSGTAVANLLPSVVEASLARVPLVLLTADRPPELRDRGAPQTIDQVRIFGGNVRWFAELPLLDGAPETRRHARSVVGRAVAVAQGTPGWAGPPQHRVPRAARSVGAARADRSDRRCRGRPAGLDPAAVHRCRRRTPGAVRIGRGRARGPAVVRRARPDPGRSAGRSRAARRARPARRRDGLSDPRGPAVAGSLRAARPVARRQPRRPPGPPRGVARRASARARDPVRGDPDVQAAADHAVRRGADPGRRRWRRRLERSGHPADHVRPRRRRDHGLCAGRCARRSPRRRRRRARARGRRPGSTPIAPPTRR